MTNKWKKMLTAVVMVLLVALVVPVMIPTRENIAEAASKSKKPALYSTDDGKVREKMLMNVGNDVTLKLRGAEGKVSWESSNKKVATVKKGKVVAVGKGECTIAATDSKTKKKYQCQIKVTNWLKANVSSIKMKVGETKTIKLKYDMQWGDVPYRYFWGEENSKKLMGDFQFDNFKAIDEDGASTITLTFKAKKAGKTSLDVMIGAVYDDADWQAYWDAWMNAYDRGETFNEDEVFFKYVESQEYISIPVTITK